MAVSQPTERKLRDAMDRLCNGTSQHTDGQLTVSNLAKEAGVSRATANRAETVLAEFHNRIVALQETPEKLPGLRDQNRELERRFAVCGDRQIGPRGELDFERAVGRRLRRDREEGR